jgi:LPS export ABC transporter protein LptC
MSSSLFLLDTGSVDPIESNASTELIFENFSLIELNEEGVAQQLSGSFALKDKRYFALNDINVTYQKSHHLVAKQAHYQDKFIYFDDRVEIFREDGVHFETKGLSYALDRGSIQSPKAFSLEMNRSRITGEGLHYNLNSKRIWADHIHANIIFE